MSTSLKEGYYWIKNKGLDTIIYRPCHIVILKESGYAWKGAWWPLGTYIELIGRQFPMPLEQVLEWENVEFIPLEQPK